MPVYERKASELPKTSTIPLATYHFRVAKAGIFTVEDAREKKPDTKLQDDMLELDCVVMDEGKYLGRHVFDSLPLSGEFAYRTRNFLDSIGYPEDENIDTDKLVDAEFYNVLKLQKETADYPEKNRLGKFIAIEKGRNEKDAPKE